jgi:hypothetical protein
MDELSAFLLKHANCYIDTCIPHLLDASSGYKGKRVHASYYNPRYTFVDDKVGARRCLPVVGARLQAYINGGFFQQFFVLDRTDSVDFGMSLSASDMITFSDNGVVMYNYCSDHWVGSGITFSITGQLDTPCNIFFVFCHHRFYLIPIFAFKN